MLEEVGVQFTILECQVWQDIIGKLNYVQCDPFRLQQWNDYFQNFSMGGHRCCAHLDCGCLGSPYRD